MGKVIDIIGGLILLVLAVWFFSRLGLTFSSLTSTFWHFFFGTGSSTNTTAGVIGAVSSSKLRDKIQRKKLSFIRTRVVDLLTRTGRGSH